MNNHKLSLISATSALVAMAGSPAFSGGRSAVVYENWPSVKKQQAHGEGRRLALHNQQYLLPQIQSTPRGWRRTQ